MRSRWRPLKGRLLSFIYSDTNCPLWVVADALGRIAWEGKISEI
jgi:hypothetical protein